MKAIGSAGVVAVGMLALLVSAAAQGQSFANPASGSGPDGRLSGWVRDLAAEDQITCARAAAALGSLGPDAASAVPELVAVLTRERGVVLGDAVVPARPIAVAAVIEALGRIGAEAAPALVAAARATSDDGTRDLLALALVRIGPVARPGLARLGGSSASEDRLWAMSTLERIDR